MKKLFLIALLFSAAAGESFAGSHTLAWAAMPKPHTLPAQYAKESAVYILEKEVVDYAVEGEGLYIFNTRHRIIKVLDDQGIEAFNTVTIPNNGLEVTDIKSRVILPGGKVIETPKDKIKESRSEDNRQQFVFALEGLEKGAEVELMFTTKHNFSLAGSSYFQSSLPRMHVAFELKTPKQLLFETKGYNGFPIAIDSVNADTAAYYTRIYHCAMDSIPGLKEEDESNYSANIKRIEYRVAYLPLTKPGQRQFTWNDLARKMFEEKYKYTDRETNVVKKYLKTIGVNKSDAETDKIHKIEDALKKDINTSKDLDKESEAFDVIVSKKVTTEDGLTRFFAACFTEAEVVHELGITSNRYEHEVDEKFENWRRLDYYLFYFPNQKAYLAPTVSNTRMPFISSPFLCNKAIFCKVTTLGTTRSALASVRTINPLPAEMTQNNIDATIRFTGDNLVPEVTSKVSYGGYSALSLRSAFLYTPKEHEKELVGNITDIATGLEEINSYSVENVNLDNFYTNKPLVVNTVVAAHKLMDKAGPKFLFKVGEVIGHQSEMYQTEERKLPIETSYPHLLKRQLVVLVPDGYSVSNPEALNRNIVQKNVQGKDIMGFTSGYKQDGNRLIIDIVEYYEVMQLPASEFPAFSKVINAAADFNKIVLVLEKK
jgi:hypothetical protein